LNIFQSWNDDAISNIKQKFDLSKNNYFQVAKGPFKFQTFCDLVPDVIFVYFEGKKKQYEQEAMDSEKRNMEKLQSAQQFEQRLKSNLAESEKYKK